MTRPEPTITLDVDLRNPGQFLACCGLLELASRIDDSAVGWFNREQFHVRCSKPGFLLELTVCPIARNSPPNEQSAPNNADSAKPSENGKELPSPPIYIGEPFNLLLDWWTDGAATEAGFKTWSAGMTVLGFIDGGTRRTGKKEIRSSGMRQHMSHHLGNPRTLLTNGVDLIDDPMPFNFDSRLSRNNALDLGFTGKIKFAFSPAVELLALIGLQRFRPRVIQRWQHNVFSTWALPLGVTTASAVAHGLLPTLAHSTHRFSIIPRDSKARYKLFGPARLARGIRR